MRFWQLAFVAIPIVVAVPPCPASEPVRSISILYISGAEAGSSHTAAELESLKAGLQESNVFASVYMESLDEMRFGLTEDITKIVTDSIERRFGAIRFDIILAQSGGAVEYALRYRNAHSPGTPLYAFDFLETSAAKRLADERDAYGRVLNEPFPPTLRLALRFFPRARRALLVVPKGRADNEEFLDLVEAERSRFPSLGIEVLSSADAAGIDAAFSASGGDAFGIVMSRDMATPGGETVTNGGIAGYLAAKYDVPLFNFVREFLGSGYIGGYSNDEEATGREASEMVLAILYGKDKPVPWRMSESPTLNLDYRALKRHAISMDLVPEGARVLFALPPFWIRYQGPLQVAGVVLLLLIVALVAYIAVRRHDKEALRRSNKALEAEVARRTEELRAANVELESANGNLVASLRRIEAMQDRLVADAKDVVLGRLALGLAHEINNPLGAISASNATMLELISSSDKGIAPSMLALGRPQLELFVALAELKAHEEIRTAPPSREQRSELAARLGRLGVGNPQAMAELVWDAGEDRLDDERLARLCAPENRKVLEALFLISALGRSIAVSEIGTRKIAETIESIRSYARDEAGDGSRATVDVAASIEDALRLLGEADEAYASIRPEVDRASLGPIVAERASLARLWANLAQNALEAAGKSGDVLIRAYGEGSWDVVEVSDSGPGVPESLRDHLFEPMATPLAAEARGIGLGLSICKRIVEAYGGSIDHEESGGRTVFRVRLPRAEASP